MNKKTTLRSVVSDAEAYVRQLLRDKLPSAFLFHNLDRTLDYLSLSTEFADSMKLSSKDNAAIQLALLFRNTGFTQQTDQPFQESAAIANRWLAEHLPDQALSDKVAQLIRHSAPGHKPVSKLDKIVNDIVWSVLGLKQFSDHANLLRLEEESLKGETISAVEWDQEMLDLLAHSNYYTSFGREHFLDRKIKNLAAQREHLVKMEQVAVREKTGKDFGRGVDTIYRVAFRNHMNLSQIADGKANMIISINTAVISGGIGFGTLVLTSTEWQMELQKNLPFLLPAVVLLLSSLTAVVFAVFSAIPKVSQVPFTEEEIENHQVSLLYFGNFIKMPKTNFVRYLQELKEDQSILYDDLARDLYTLGLVLDKKYRLLIYAYRVFVGGLVFSLLLLILVGIAISQGWVII